MKNRVRIKFPACFKPVVSDEQPPFYSALSSDIDDEGAWRRKAVQRSFSSTMKPAFFKSLAKKIGGRKSRQDSYRSNNSLSSPKREKFINTTKKKSCNKGSSDHEGMSRTNSNRSSLFSSASPSSASSFSSNSASETIKELTSTDLKQTDTRNKYQASKSDACRSIYNSTSSGMFVILVCLAALVLWGKAFALVVCTSTWLLLAPGRQPRAVETPENDAVFDSVEHKKRVVMEGLLQRDRPRAL